MMFDYYNQRSQSFFDQTVDINMKELYEPFLKLLPPSTHILDAGCGSGRDTKAFLELGYTVTAIDAAEAMVALSSEFTGHQTLWMSFNEMTFDTCFDGIWACASLLHVPSDQIYSVFQRFEKALKPNGIWYLSFKLGSGERWHEGRFFNDFDEDRFSKVISAHPVLEIMKVWQTSDRKVDRNHERWLNALVAKRLYDQ